MTTRRVRPVIRNPDRGRWGRFLLAQREARGWTQIEAFDQLRAGLGLGPGSRSSYVNLERGSRQPNADEQRFLARFYGAEPLDEPEVPVDDRDALVAALARQTDAMERQVEAITGLTKEIRVAALAVLSSQEGSAELLADLVAGLASGGTLSELASSLQPSPGQ